ncbi:protein-tyrosine phosphatase-like protein [Crepidotus variabilis]|uniref:protein-tyrosine-phosphatase n=1 Tax=Crepidotus variabilis TaxID=179855 RepID=A0A9P6E4B8_9AGAR|nr:protein-tyrosine phosphatase-like protein [Crepidotus variabilis]
MPRFDELPLAVQEAMTTPFHLILGEGTSEPVPESKSESLNTDAILPNPTPTPTPHTIPTPTPPQKTQKLGSLYLGSLSAVVDPSIAHLRALHISHIVQVMDLPWLVLTKEDGFECYKFAIEDVRTQPLDPEMLQGVCGYIHGVRSASEGQSGNVLVHCQQGVSRSATVVIAYLMRYEGMSLAEALAFVKDKRACVKPNVGFMRCLKVWEEVQIAARARGGAVEARGGGGEEGEDNLVKTEHLKLED